MNQFQTPLTEELLNGLHPEVKEQLLDFINNVPFIQNLISSSREYAKDRPRDEEGKIVVDLCKPHILENMDYFRPTAIHYQKYGKLTVSNQFIRQIKAKKDGTTIFRKNSETPVYQIKWLCKCQCGQEKYIPYNCIKNYMSCGCSRKDKIGYGISAKRKLLYRYKKDAELRNYKFSLTEEQFYKFVNSNCFYCGCDPSSIQKTYKNNGNFIYNGIDRKDNSFGYIIENCVTCCSMCNIMKSTMSHEQFLSKTNEIFNHLQSKGI